jgi:glycosyltransferase involved in cell wall biosynthesis
MVNQQLNDFGYCQPGYDDFVDVYTSPSSSHMEFIRGHTPSPHKWMVLPNGCDPSQYDPKLKVPGRVIYASSPDRGLHLLLQSWPAIKRAVPGANLRVFYNMDDWISRFTGCENGAPDFVELGNRARYIDLALRRMSNLDIVKVGSVSREQIAREMSEATVLAYPCDTICFTEGFSVTTMEACASGAVPVISSVDSLGQIYGDHTPTVRSPVSERLTEFSDLVVRGLSDSAFRDSVLSKTLKLANSHRWSSLVETIECAVLARGPVS